METFTIPTKDDIHAFATLPCVNGAPHKSFGVLVLSPELRVSFINEEARKIVDQLQSVCQEPEPHEPSSSRTLSIIDTLIRMVFHPNLPQRMTTIKSRSIKGPSETSVFLHGIQFPQGAGLISRHALLIMETVHTNLEKGSPKGIKFPKRYGLTERQKTIVRYVTVGLTNKQIAEELGISVYTVKEHIKHVMRKTETNTRTAAIARLTRRKPLKLHRNSSPTGDHDNTMHTVDKTTLCSQPTDECREKA